MSIKKRLNAVLMAFLFITAMFFMLGIRTHAEETDSLIPLGTPDNVHWNSEIPGQIVFTGVEPSQGQYLIKAYLLRDGEGVCVYSGYWRGLDGYREFHSDSFIVDVFGEDGDYYFTVQAIGDKKEYSDSEIASSDVFHYQKPGQSLAEPINLKWEWPRACWEYDEDETYVLGRCVRFYFAENEDVEPREVGRTMGGFYNNQADVYDNVLRNGEGVYYFKVMAYSRDITTISNSSNTEFSSGYYYTPKDIEEELDDILKKAEEGAQPSEIRQAVYDLSREKLREAMVADNDDTGVNLQLQALENATGASLNVDVAENVNAFDESLIQVTGALLNPLAQDNVTLNITKPTSNVVLPEMYNSSIAVSFGMDLDGLFNTAYLRVPVKITLPIPDTINPAFLRILHYPFNTSGMDEVYPEETIYPYVFQKDGQWYASFVLDHFSDFVMTEEVDDIIIGDVNGDGKINTLDRMILARYLAKWDGYEERIADMRAADVNGDGKVNTLDRMILARYLAKWDGYEKYFE